MIQHDVEYTHIEFTTKFYPHFIDQIPQHHALSPIITIYIESTSNILLLLRDMGLQSVWPDDFLIEFKQFRVGNTYTPESCRYNNVLTHH